MVEVERFSRVRGPTYARPYSQIFWMVVVLGAVGTIGWLWLQDALLQIFLANRWLNSLIVAVFVVGVAVAIWQAIRLVPAQTWAERFAVGREGLAQPPQLLASMSALLAAPEHRSALAPTTTSAIIESVNSRVSEGRDLTRYLGGLLIFLGLLGTFWGLARTVPALIETIRALTPQEGEAAVDAFQRLTGGFENQLRAMGTAFSSSLLGLAGSLIVGLLDLLGGQAQSRFLREFENWASSQTRLDLGVMPRGGGSELEMVNAALLQNAQQMERVIGGLRSLGTIHTEAIRLRIRSIEALVASLARSSQADPRLVASLQEELSQLRREVGAEARSQPRRTR